MGGLFWNGLQRSPLPICRRDLGWDNLSSRPVTGFRFLIALLALPFLGYALQSFSAFRTLHPAARWGLAGAFGAIMLCVQMLLFTWLGIRWSIWLLLCLPVLIAIGRRRFRRQAHVQERDGRTGLLAIIVTLVTLGATTYASVTARATSSDLLLFWGTKGQRFAQMAGIDVGFLRDPEHFLMHADYPPMLPCLYAWATLVAGRFAWGAALLSLPLFLMLAILTFFGFARPVLGRVAAAEYASILAALLAFVLISSYTAGNAEPLLIYFQVVALSAIVFAIDRPEGLPAAGVALAGGVLTKVEGMVFAALVVFAAVILMREARRWRSLTLLAGAPAIALAAWVFFCRSHGLLDFYDLNKRSQLMLGHIPVVLREVGRQAAYDAWFMPWIVVFVLSIGGKRTRASFLALAVALGFGGFIICTYLTSKEDPTLWIQWSAARLLITPLLCLFFVAPANASANAKSTRGEYHRG
jgi:hypothetical protein